MTNDIDPHKKQILLELETRALELVKTRGSAISIVTNGVEYNASYHYQTDRLDISFVERPRDQRFNGIFGNLGGHLTVRAMNGPVGFTGYDSLFTFPPQYEVIEAEILPALRAEMILDDLANT